MRVGFNLRLTHENDEFVYGSRLQNIVRSSLLADGGAWGFSIVMSRVDFDVIAEF